MADGMAPHTLAVVLALLITPARVACAGVAEHLSALDPVADPFAERDAFVHLSEGELRSSWSADDGSSLNSKLEALTAVEHALFVEVRLVGFQGEGNGGVTMPEHALARYLEAMSVSEPAHVLGRQGDGHGARRTRISYKPHFHVTHAPKELTGRIEREIAEHVGERDDGTVPFDAVDALLDADHQTSAEAFTLYLLSPNAPRGPAVARARYSYTQPEGGVSLQPRRDGAPAHSGECTALAWLARGRYAWVDLSAGPVSYGPSTTGLGAVNERTLPAVRASAPVLELALELAALAADGALHILAPPIMRLPAPPTRRTVVRVYEIRLDLGASHTHKGRMRELEDASEASGIDFRAIETELQRVRLPNEAVSLETVVMPLGSCAPCAAALQYALQARSSSVHADGELSVQTTGYVDARELAHWLRVLREPIDRCALESDSVRVETHTPGTTATLRGSSEGASSGSAADEQLVRAYVLTLATDRLLLLDGQHSALAVDDVAIAVQLPFVRLALLDVSCAGAPVTVDTTVPQRPLLGALLEAGWGLGSVHDRYDGHTRAKATNYLWATGHSPFSPFSVSHELAASYADNARRARLYAVLVPMLERVHGLLRRFEPIGKELDEVLTAHEHVQFVRRWNFFRHKLERAMTCGAHAPATARAAPIPLCARCTRLPHPACTRARRARRYLSMFNFGQAAYYALSMQHDERAMEEIVQLADNHLAAHLHCETGRLTSWSLGAWTAVCMAALLLVGTVGAVSFGAWSGGRGGARGSVLALRFGARDPRKTR